MRTTAIIARVLAQLQEFFDIQVPCFQIGANCALALTTLVYSNGGVIHYL